MYGNISCGLWMLLCGKQKLTLMVGYLFLEGKDSVSQSLNIWVKLVRFPRQSSTLQRDKTHIIKPVGTTNCTIYLVFFFYSLTQNVVTKTGSLPLF